MIIAKNKYDYLYHHIYQTLAHSFDGENDKYIALN